MHGLWNNRKSIPCMYLIVDSYIAAVWWRDGNVNFDRETRPEYQVHKCGTYVKQIVHIDNNCQPTSTVCTV